MDKLPSVKDSFIAQRYSHFRIPINIDAKIFIKHMSSSSKMALIFITFILRVTLASYNNLPKFYITNVVVWARLKEKNKDMYRPLVS